jgi:hypothetical protein
MSRIESRVSIKVPVAANRGGRLLFAPVRQTFNTPRIGAIPRNSGAEGVPDQRSVITRLKSPRPATIQYLVAGTVRVPPASRLTPNL